MEREDMIIHQLAENSASLQKVSLGLIERMSELTKRIDRLVSLFEEASKHLEDVQSQEDRMRGLTEKLETLLEQNKDIAHGLVLLDKYVRGKSEFEGLSNKNQRSF